MVSMVGTAFVKVALEFLRQQLDGWKLRAPVALSFATPAQSATQQTSYPRVRPFATSFTVAMLQPGVLAKSRHSMQKKEPGALLH